MQPPASRDAQPDEHTEPSVYFVTDTDPIEWDDFPLINLVRGELGEGQGWVREPDAWEPCYVPVLDYENHMPADEGDLRPYGGEYLKHVVPELETLAIEFWETEFCMGPMEEALSWSEFEAWAATRRGG